MPPFLKICISLFILFMLLFMLYWDREATNPIKKHWMPKLQPLFLWMGLTHTWRMFAPDPPKHNQWPKIKIYLKSGDFFVWEPTRYSDLNVLDKVRYKKFHKFYHELSRNKTAFHTKIDFVHYLLHKYDLQDQCVKLEFYRIILDIPAYGATLETPPTPTQQLIYTYNI